MAQQANKRRYVFHFDINNTILMKDDAKGISMQDNVSVMGREARFES